MKKKLKLHKIKLSELPLHEQKDIVGGTGTVTVTVTTVTTRTMNTWPGCYTDGCLTKKPGHQDSCGLCTTNYACY